MLPEVYVPSCGEGECQQGVLWAEKLTRLHTVWHRITQAESSRRHQGEALHGEHPRRVVLLFFPHVSPHMTTTLAAPSRSCRSARHPEIQTMEVDFLFQRVSDPALVSRLPKWFQYLENGELHPGAGAVFSTLVNKLITGGVRRCPKNCNSTFKCNNCGQNVQ